MACLLTLLRLKTFNRLFPSTAGPSSRSFKDIEGRVCLAFLLLWPSPNSPVQDTTPMKKREDSGCCWIRRESWDIFLQWNPNDTYPYHVPYRKVASQQQSQGKTPLLANAKRDFDCRALWGQIIAIQKEASQQVSLSPRPSHVTSDVPIEVQPAKMPLGHLATDGDENSAIAEDEEIDLSSPVLPRNRSGTFVFEQVVVPFIHREVCLLFELLLFVSGLGNLLL